MRRFWSLSLTAFLLLSACGSAPRSQSGSGGSRGLLPAGTFSGYIQTTSIKSDGSTGNIAVMVASPQMKRYPEGAGVVVVIPPIFSEADGFMRNPDLASLGLVQVSYLWPGEKDTETGAHSEGEFDYGGANSIKVLRDVIRFAGGRLADINGRYIFGMTSVPPLTEEIGLYAFGDAGLAAVKALSLYGDQFQGLQYYVGRENPNMDALACMEIGYYDDAGKPVYNPFYHYPASYSFDQLTLNYTNLGWDPAYTSSRSKAAGRPYLDLDGNDVISTGDYIFDGQTPLISGKRVYSTALTQALLDSGALSQAAWPADLATPQEAAQVWQFLQSPDRFAVMQGDTILQTLKVMLVFAQNDHAQVALDKPHIHQAYQGFRFEAKLWVRLNPDRAYVQDMLQKYAGAGPATLAATATAGPALDFPDTPANTQPDDWTKIGDYAYPGQEDANQLVPLAGVAEMADRAHAGFWDENLGAVLYTYGAATPTP